MHTNITVKEIKIKNFRYIGHLTIKFVFSNKGYYEEKTIKFQTLCWYLDEYENKILTDVEFLKRFLQTCHKYNNISILTKNVCERHKHYINSFIFNL